MEYEQKYLEKGCNNSLWNVRFLVITPGDLIFLPEETALLCLIQCE